MIENCLSRVFLSLCNVYLNSSELSDSEKSLIPSSFSTQTNSIKTHSARSTNSQPAYCTRASRPRNVSFTNEVITRVGAMLGSSTQDQSYVLSSGTSRERIFDLTCTQLLYGLGRVIRVASNSYRAHNNVFPRAAGLSRSGGESRGVKCRQWRAFYF